ncbi:acyltransferase [Halobacillus salinus]|uniref:Acyltransferase n=1 Tax=Halobacillus salinus TaxID=192814 RepID=A0A4Z0GXC7_9BACI|nr:acyltransferase [Halobacillus salinus]TGB02479.1 acyltransferase [Halobacillus salinus]
MDSHINRKMFYDEIPFVRAIACLMVVMVHTTARNYTGEGFTGDTAMLMNQFSRLGTPVFAVVSAFLLTSSVIKRGFSLKRFVTSRAVKIVSPYIIWSLVYLLFIKYFHEGLIFRNAKQTFDYIVLGDAKTHLWFIAAIIQFYIVFPLLQLIRKRELVLALFIVSLPINYYWLGDMYPDLTPVFGKFTYIITDLTFFLNWISYFLFGSVLAYYWEEVVQFVKKYQWLVVGVTIAVWAAIYYEISPDVVLGSARVQNLLYIPLWVLFLILVSKYVLKSDAVYKPFRVIGDYSMGIYLLHPLILDLILEVVPGWFTNAGGLVAAYVLAVAICTGVMKLISLMPMSTFIVPIPKPKKPV